MRLGIRYRLLLPLGLLLCGVVGTSLWSARVAALRAQQRIAAQVRGISQTLSSATFPLTPPVLEQMKALSGAEFILITPDRARMATLDQSGIVLPEERVFDQFADVDIGPTIEIGEARYRCRRLVLRDPHINAGSEVYVLYPESLRDEAIADAERPSMLGLVFGLLAVVFTFGIGQRLVSRIRALERRTRQISRGDFDPMPLPASDDELRDLSRSVNEMASRLSQLQAELQMAERTRLSAQLASGLAHQLRNSVTGARLALQLFLDDPSDDREPLDVTLRQLSLMESTLRRFIDVGRPRPAKSDSVELHPLLQSLADLHGPRCRHAHIQLRVDAAPGIIVHGDPELLLDAFGNLIGNAIEAVGTNGQVHVTVKKESGRVVCEVSDTGPGPSADVADRLFEPFVTGKPEGIGLGLAVVKLAVEAHDGRISWERRLNQTVFRVELPGSPIPA